MRFWGTALFVVAIGFLMTPTQSVASESERDFLGRQKDLVLGFWGKKARSQRELIKRYYGPPTRGQRELIGGYWSPKVKRALRTAGDFYRPLYFQTLMMKLLGQDVTSRNYSVVEEFHRGLSEILPRISFVDHAVQNIEAIVKPEGFEESIAQGGRASQTILMVEKRFGVEVLQVTEDFYDESGERISDPRDMAELQIGQLIHELFHIWVSHPSDENIELLDFVKAVGRRSQVELNLNSEDAFDFAEEVVGNLIQDIVTKYLIVNKVAGRIKAGNISEKKYPIIRKVSEVNWNFEPNMMLGSGYVNTKDDFISAKIALPSEELKRLASLVFTEINLTGDFVQDFGLQEYYLN